MKDELVVILLLLALFQIKHFLIDFCAQFEQKDSIKKFYAEGWIWPLFKHSGQHSIATLLISFVFLTILAQFSLSSAIFWSFWLAIFDLTIHFGMDRLKASPFLLGKFKYPSREYFYSLGFDQMVHHFTHYAIIATLFCLYYGSLTFYYACL